MINSGRGADTNIRFAAGLPLFTILHAAIALAIAIAAVTAGPLRDAPSTTATDSAAGSPTQLAAPGPAENAPAASRAADGVTTASSLSPATDRYYTAGELDLRAGQINDVELIYPKAAYEMRIRGRVVLELLIDDAGRIDAISVLESVPAGIFDKHALGAAAALKFSPAIKAGRPVKSRKKIEIVFDPYQSISVP